MNRTIIGLSALVIGAGLMSACSTEPKSESDKATLAATSTSAIDRFRNKDATLQGLIDKAEGYAVFPEVGKGGFIVGGSYGRGEVYQKGGKRIGYADISQMTVGLQAGAQGFAAPILFLKKEDFENLKNNRFEFAANASAVAATAGAGASSDPQKGTLVFVIPTGGLMAEAAIGGQRFTYKPM